MENFKQKLTRIKTILLDVDGVLTNGQVLIMENGEFIPPILLKEYSSAQ